MRIRVSDTELAAAFVGLARLRPDVVLMPVPARPAHDAAGEEFDVGLLGSFSAEARASALGRLVGGWGAQLRRAGNRADLEVVR